MLDIEIWERNSFEVQAVRVTSQNIGEVATWTNGELMRGPAQNSKWYVLLDMTTGSRFPKAYVDDWVVLVNGQFRIYKHDSIKLVYHKKLADREKLIKELFEQALVVDNWNSEESFEDLVNRFTAHAMSIIEGRESE
jgi:formaldehyde-activating enzyme involved in methanogenesis